MDNFKCQSKGFLSDFKKDGQDLLSKTKSLPGKVKGLLKSKKSYVEDETNVGTMFQYRDPDDYNVISAGKTLNEPQFQKMDKFSEETGSASKTFGGDDTENRPEFRDGDEFSGTSSMNKASHGIENDEAQLHHETKILPTANENEPQSSNSTYI